MLLHKINYKRLSFILDNFSLATGNFIIIKLLLKHDEILTRIVTIPHLLCIYECFRI